MIREKITSILKFVSNLEEINQKLDKQNEMLEEILEIVKQPVAITSFKPPQINDDFAEAVLSSFGPKKILH